MQNNYIFYYKYLHTTNCTAAKGKAFGRTRKTPGTQDAIYATTHYTGEDVWAHAFQSMSER